MMIDETYYDRDTQVGVGLRWNDLDVYDEYNADLIDIKFSGRDIKTDVRRNTGGTRLQQDGYEMGNGSVTTYYYVGGNSKTDALRNVARLVSAMQQGIMRHPDFDYELSCTLTAYMAEDTGVDAYYRVSMTHDCIKRRKGEPVALSGTTARCYYDGTYDTGCYITCVAKSSEVTVSIDDRWSVVISNCAPGEIIAVDGINGEITRNGVNCFGDSNLWRFPRLVPGYNNIEVTGADTLRVDYYHVYL